MSERIPIGTIITTRDLSLLRTLSVARVLDSEGMRRVGGFSSVRRTNRRLLKLVRAGCLKRWFVGTAAGGQRALYGLTPQGASLIHETRKGLIRWRQDALITNSAFLDHQQAINEVFLVTCFEPLPSGVSCKSWAVVREPLSPSIPLIPDAYLELAKAEVVHSMFLEVDLGTERALIWKRKVELYLKFALGGEFERLFHAKRFRVLVVLPNSRRLEAVRQMIAARTDKLFWLTTQDAVRTHGMAGPIWLRPTGTERVAVV